MHACVQGMLKCAMHRFYIVRVPAGRSGQFVKASVRAACLADGPNDETLGLHLDVHGNVMSIDYSASNVNGRPCEPTRKPSLPTNSTVIVKSPLEGPMIVSAANSGNAMEAFASAVEDPNQNQGI